MALLSCPPSARAGSFPKAVLPGHASTGPHLAASSAESKSLPPFALAVGAVAAAAVSATTRRRGTKNTSNNNNSRQRATPVVQLGASTSEGSRVVAVVGRDGVGKSKVCAGLLDLAADTAKRAADGSFAQKSRLLEAEPGEATRNFSCFSHVYSQRDGRGPTPRLHLIDTPGHVDRLPLVEDALHIAQGAVVVCSINGGVDAACGRAFAAVERSRKPSVIFLNGVDRADGAPGFLAALDALERRLGVRPVVLFAPAHVVGAESGSLLLNVVSGTLCSTQGCDLEPVTEIADSKSRGKKPTVIAKTPEITKFATQLREQLVEALANVDDELMEAYLETDGKVARPLLEAALHRAAAAGLISPLVAGSAKTGLGLDALQEVIGTFIPGGSGDLGAQLGLQPATPGAVAFRQLLSGQEHLVEARVVQGPLRPGEPCQLAGVVAESVFKGLSSRVVTVTPKRLLVHSARGEVQQVQEVHEGDMVLLPVDVPIALARHSAAEPGSGVRRGRCTFALQLGGLKPEQREALLRALDVLLQAGDGLRLETNEETGDKFLSFMGTLHLELVRERLVREFKIKTLPLGQPHVAYHATVKSPVVGKSAPAPKKGVAWALLELLPGKRDSGLEIQDELAKLDPTRGGKVTAEVETALDRVLRSALGKAGPGNIPVVDVIVKVLDLAAASEQQALEAVTAAARLAMSSAAGNLVLLEPVVELEADVPSKCVGRLQMDLKDRRGEVLGTRHSEGENQVVAAEVPLREILNFDQDLNKLTEGEGFFTFRLQGYQEVTPVLQKRILAELTDPAS